MEMNFKNLHQPVLPKNFPPCRPRHRGQGFFNGTLKRVAIHSLGRGDSWEANRLLLFLLSWFARPLLRSASFCANFQGRSLWGGVGGAGLPPVDNTLPYQGRLCLVSCLGALAWLAKMRSRVWTDHPLLSQLTLRGAAEKIITRLTRC